MAIPEGYAKLAVVGMAWKGDYVADTAYKAMNAVYYDGSTYVALRDNPTGPPVADNTNWMYLAKGFVTGFDGSASTVSAIDTQGIGIKKETGTGQVTMGDAAEGPVVSLEVTGKSEQVATTGAQLLNTEAYELGIFSNTTGNANASDNTYRWLQYIPVTAGNTIYFSKPLCVFYYDANKVFVSCDESAGITQSVVPSRAAFVRCRTFAADFSAFNHRDYMVSKNPVNEWEPYTGGQPSPSPEHPQEIIGTGSGGSVLIAVTGGSQSQNVTIPLATPLHGIGDYQDRIMCKSGTWGIERQIGKIDNNQWEINNIAAGGVGHRFVVTPNGIVNESNALVLCSKYQHKKINSYNNAGDYIATDELQIGRVHIRTRDTDFDSAAAFRTFMTDAVTIYPLATPIWEPLPAETQVALNALTTYTGATTIAITAEGPLADVAVEYLGTVGSVTTAQKLLDALAQKVAKELVSNNTLATQLAGYVAKSAIAQTESTRADMVPSSAYFKQVVDTQNGNLGTVSSNLNTVKNDISPVTSSPVDNADINIVNKVNMVIWNPNTVSTPFKTGNTSYGNGFCITYSTGNQWLCQLAMAVGDSHLFTRHRREGTWSGWTTIGAPTI